MFRERFNPLYTESGPDLWVKHKTKKIFYKFVLAFFRYLVTHLGRLNPCDSQVIKHIT